MKKKKVKINFVDFWNNFNPRDNFLYNILSENFEISLSDDPDFLFFSVFGHKHLKYNCVKIFYTGENQAPDFNITDYAIGFEKMDFGDRYLRFPYCYLESSDFKLMETKHLAKNIDIKERGFCSFVYSNNNSSDDRELMLQALNGYKQVSSGGRYKNNVGGPVNDKNAFQSRFKFSIAFENCSHDGYITEKLIQSFAAGTVPIYWGDPSVDEMFNEDSFINVRKFSSLNDVVEEVKRIDNDDEAYLAMIAAPALRNPERDSLDNAFRRLSDFLVRILSQERGEAYRFSRHYWAKRYLSNQLQLYRSFDRSVIGISKIVYAKTLWKWRNSNKLMWKLDRMLK